MPSWDCSNGNPITVRGWGTGHKRVSWMASLPLGQFFAARAAQGHTAVLHIVIEGPAQGHGHVLSYVGQRGIFQDRCWWQNLQLTFERLALNTQLCTPHFSHRSLSVSSSMYQRAKGLRKWESWRSLDGHEALWQLWDFDWRDIKKFLIKHKETSELFTVTCCCEVTAYNI